MTQTPGYCNSCGAELRPNARFCNVCGNAVGDSQPIEPTVYAPSPAPTYSAPPTPVYDAYAPPAYDSNPPAPAPKRKTNPALLYAGIAVIGLCTICVGIAIVLGGYRLFSEKKPEQTATAAATNTALFTPTNTAIPTNTPVPTDTPRNEVMAPLPSTGEQVSYEGITFSYDASLANRVNSSTLPATSGSDLPPWEIAPQTYLFEFKGYDHPLETFHSPQMVIYPANDYIAISAEAATVIADLKTFLQQKPASPDSIPFLPMWNAAQMMQANIRYLSFQNGNGVRFLSQYGQASYPISSKNMFYTFQGLTSDGRYYISAILPVYNPILPDPDTVTQDDAFYNNFGGYVQGIEAQLGAQLDGSFTPSLALLDAMIQSILINK